MPHDLIVDTAVQHWNNPPCGVYRGLRTVVEIHLGRDIQHFSRLSIRAGGARLSAPILQFFFGGANRLNKPIAELRMGSFVIMRIGDAIDIREQFCKPTRYFRLGSALEHSCHGGEAQRHVDNVLGSGFQRDCLIRRGQT